MSRSLDSLHMLPRPRLLKFFDIFPGVSLEPPIRSLIRFPLDSSDRVAIEARTIPR